LLSLLDAAVAKRLVADVPVGVFLSGGVDSTSIAALAVRHKKPLQTFSIGFTEESFDESPWAALASQRLGTEHVSEKFSGQDCMDLLPAAAAHLDEPFADPSFLPTLLLSRFTRKHVKVALAGDGGDELFAGYDPFLAHRPAAAFALVPRPLRSLLQTAVHLLPASSRNMSLDFRLKQFLRGVDAPPSLRHASWLASFLPR
jgi:asparagine synthase (glutamine-hydrolysing)